MTQIEWTARARKQFRKFDAQPRKRIIAAIGELINWPNCRNVRALVDREGYRLRVGPYRVVFTVQSGRAVIVTIVEVKKRDERTY